MKNLKNMHFPNLWPIPLSCYFIKQNACIRKFIWNAYMVKVTSPRFTLFIRFPMLRNS